MSFAKSPAPPQHVGRVVAGLLAAGVQLSASELAATLFPGATSSTTAIGRAAIGIAPGPVVDVVVALVNEKDKPLLFGGIVGAFLGAGLFDGYRGTRGDPRGVGMLAMAGATTVAVASGKDGGRISSSIAIGLGTAAGLGVLRGLIRWTHPGLHAATLVAGAGVALLAKRRAGHRRRTVSQARRAITLPAPTSPAPSPQPNTRSPIEGLGPIFTPNDSFYVTDVTFPSPPVIDPRRWRLRVKGQVERDLTFALSDLLALPLIELDATLVCVHNPVGGDRVGTGRWLGISVADLIRRADPLPGATHLLARSVDGFTASVPLDLVLGERPAIIAVGMNGEPLPFEHGFPARLLVPGRYGYDANTKWVAELELTTLDGAGDYWTRRGWALAAGDALPQCRIDVPQPWSALPSRHVWIAGVAWCSPEGVDAVEVSIDGGPWQPTLISSELAPTAWRQWSYRWDATPGTHEVAARVNGRRRVQSELKAPPYPHGASGYHRVPVVVIPQDSAMPKTLALRKVTDEMRSRLALAALGVRFWLHHGWPLNELSARISR